MSFQQVQNSSSLYRASELLAIDKVLTISQMKRWASDYFERPLPPPKLVRAERGVYQVYVDEDFLEAIGNNATLLHYAGLGEMRRVLGVDPIKWKILGLDYSGKTPDAFWQLPTGQVAVEFDMGHYPRRKIDEKIAAFFGYQKQVWGVISPSRRDYIQKKLRGARGSVVLVSL